MFGQPFVVADAPAVLHDPAEGPLDDPPAGQDLEGVQVIGALDDLQGPVQRGCRPGDELPGVAAVGPGQGDRAKACGQPPQQRAGGRRRGPGRMRRWTTTHSSSPITSTAMCLFRPSIFFPASYRRLSLPTVSAPLTDWESMTAAVGAGLRPARTRTASRS